MQPGRDIFKKVCWHLHLAAAIPSTYDEYKAARLTHIKFEEIMRRETHQLKSILNPGDLYVWDNFRLLYSREEVCKSTPCQATACSICSISREGISRFIFCRSIELTVRTLKACKVALLTPVILQWT